MLIVDYNSTHGTPVADGNQKYFAKNSYLKSLLLNKKNKKLLSISVGTKSVIKEFQQLILEGFIKEDSIKFRYKGMTIKHNSKGRLNLLKGHELA